MKNKFKVLALLFIATNGLISCDKEDTKKSFNAAFDYGFIDENNVEFINKSTGEYYSLIWDFGIGEPIETTDKDKTYKIYYPTAGNYTATLSAFNFSGEKKEITETISITKDDLVVTFTASPDGSNPNIIHLTNTTQGNYDASKWVFSANEVENEQNVEAYFPYAGIYDIELIVTKGDNTFSFTQKVTISNDDPTYIENMELVWSDEFDGTTIKSSNWTFETGAGGWGNQELQNYTNGDNAEVKDGKLIITARKVNDNKAPGSYTSTRMITKGKKEFQYGRMEIRAKLPSGTGIWPAIWMLGSNISSVGWPACGEIDIMEYVGYQPNTIHAYVHTSAGYGGNGNGSSKTLTTAEEAFHIYGLIWTQKELIFYVDEPENVTHTYAPTTKTKENWPFDAPQFFILNIAVGGTWGGLQGIDNSIFPQTMEIDYVRVYQ